jgi:copper chaperone CopZ
MDMLEFRVEGMACGRCASWVSKAVDDVWGVLSAEVDIESGVVRIEGTPALDELRRAVEKAGYQVAG